MTAAASIKRIQEFRKLGEDEHASTQVYKANVAIMRFDRLCCFLVSILDIYEMNQMVAMKPILPVTTTTTTVLTDSAA